MRTLRREFETQAEAEAWVRRQRRIYENGYGVYAHGVAVESTGRFTAYVRVGSTCD